MQSKQLNNLENNNMDSTQTTDKCRCCKNFVPLTDEQISAIVQSMSAYTWDAHMLARLIEKAHGIGE